MTASPVYYGVYYSSCPEAAVFILAMSLLRDIEFAGFPTAASGVLFSSQLMDTLEFLTCSPLLRTLQC